MNDSGNWYNMSGNNYNKYDDIEYDDGMYYKWWINDKELRWNDESIVIKSKKRWKNLYDVTYREIVCKLYHLILQQNYNFIITMALS